MGSAQGLKNSGSAITNLLGVGGLTRVNRLLKSIRGFWRGRFAKAAGVFSIQPASTAQALKFSSSTSRNKTVSVTDRVKSGWQGAGSYRIRIRSRGPPASSSTGYPEVSFEVDRTHHRLQSPDKEQSQNTYVWVLTATILGVSYNSECALSPHNSSSRGLRHHRNLSDCIQLVSDAQQKPKCQDASRKLREKRGEKTDAGTANFIIRMVRKVL